MRSIKLQGDYLFNRVGICDLDGDGVFDYVIKQPGAGHGLDPGTIRPSPDTFKLEAYNGKTGAFMWRYDLGWNMNMGVWWTPFITGDFDGDGKAEVALKMAPYAATKEAATIAEGGFVLEGPEYLVVLNGMTGKEIARADWVERGDPARWGDTRGNRVNRNQIGAAKLDGKRLEHPGRARHVHADVRRRVESGRREAREDMALVRRRHRRRRSAVRARTACTSTTSTATARRRSRSGSVVVDDNGKTLWTNGLGHPDVFYVADIIPARPGLEIAYGYEDSQTINGIQVADARTGEMIWGHPQPTTHIHDWGMFADIDAVEPRLRVLCAPNRIASSASSSTRRSDGKLLSKEDMGSITLNPVYWLDGPQKVYNVFSYRGDTTVLQQVQDPRRRWTRWKDESSRSPTSSATGAKS